MSANIPQQYTISFSTNVSLLLQQKGSKLRGLVMEGPHVGKQASPVDQVGAVNASKVVTRFGAKGRTDAPLDRRWVFPVDYDLNQLIDTFDKLRLVTDPESQYVTNAVYAMGRAMDDEILANIFAASKTGEQGSTSTAFLAANVVGVNTGGTASNMNVAKIRAGKRLLLSYEVDFDNDPVFMAISSDEHDALLNEIQVISSDFNGADKPVLSEGKVQRFLGVNFIHCERVNNNDGTDDQSGTSTPIPMWAMSGMYLGVWKDAETNVSKRNDLSGEPFQAYILGTFGATRLEEKKVIKIWSR